MAGATRDYSDSRKKLNDENCSEWQKSEEKSTGGSWTLSEIKKKKPKQRGQAMVGRQVMKWFDDGWFSGIVRSFDPQVSWYCIRYEDSDQEEVDSEELEEIIVGDEDNDDDDDDDDDDVVQGNTIKRRKTNQSKVQKVKTRKYEKKGVWKKQQAPTAPKEKRKYRIRGKNDKKVVSKQRGPLGRKRYKRLKVASHQRAFELYPDGEIHKSNQGIESKTPHQSFIQGCGCKVLGSKRILSPKEQDRQGQMKPLQWPPVQLASCDLISSFHPIKHARKVWRLGEECVSLLNKLPGAIYVDQVLDEEHVGNVKKCQRQYYETWAMHDKIEREKIMMKGRGAGIYGKNGINNAIRIAERSMEDRKINTESIIGHVPGVPVNLQLQVRGELSCIGLHHPKNRAARVDLVECIAEAGQPVPLALSVVIPRSKYADSDSIDGVVFHGVGGEESGVGEVKYGKNRCYRSDDALLNCYRFGLPIRLIKQVNDNTCILKCRYSYEGLWRVADAWLDSYSSAPMKFSFVEFMRESPRGLAPRPKPRERLLCEDLSFGMEATRIPVVNDVDYLLPPGLDAKSINKRNGTNFKPDDQCFQYTPVYVYHSSVRIPHMLIELPDTDPHDWIERLNMCSPYIVQEHERIPLLSQRRSLLYECGSWCNCDCGDDCHYAVTERGIKFQLQVFRTKGKGWGVKTLEYIPAGAYVTTYTGLIIPHEVARASTGCSEYLFDMCRRTDMSNDNQFLDDHRCDIKIKYAVDAKNFGNVARFVNHSCNPNLFVQPTLSSHLDESMPKICLFASRDILKGEELTYDYGVQFVKDILKGQCLCGADNCLTTQLTGCSVDCVEATSEEAVQSSVDGDGVIKDDIDGDDFDDMSISNSFDSLSLSGGTSIFS